MDLNLFLEILGIPSTSGEEKALAQFLKEQLVLRGPNGIQVFEYEVGDGTLNLLSTGPGPASLHLSSAHTWTQSLRSSHRASIS